MVWFFDILGWRMDDVVLAPNHVARLLGSDLWSAPEYVEASQRSGWLSSSHSARCWCSFRCGYVGHRSSTHLTQAPPSQPRALAPLPRALHSSAALPMRPPETLAQYVSQRARTNRGGPASLSHPVRQRRARGPPHPNADAAGTCSPHLA